MKDELEPPLSHIVKGQPTFNMLGAVLKKTKHETFFSFENTTNITHKQKLTDTSFLSLEKTATLHNSVFEIYSDASMINHNNFSYDMVNFSEDNYDTLPNSIIAGIIKYNNEDFFCYKKSIVCLDNNMAELLAICEGLEIAQSFRMEHLRIFTDSAVSIAYIKKHTQGNKRYMTNTKFLPVTENVLSLLNNFKTCHFFHVPRKNNKEADKLTKFKRLT